MIKKLSLLCLAGLLSQASLAHDYLWSSHSNSDNVWVGLGFDYTSTYYQGSSFDPFAVQANVQYQSNSNWRHELYTSVGLGTGEDNGIKYRLNAAYGYLLGYTEKLDNDLIATLSAGVGAVNQTVDSSTENNFSPAWKFTLEEDIEGNHGWRAFLEGGGYYVGSKNRTLHVSLGIKRALAF